MRARARKDVLWLTDRRSRGGKKTYFSRRAQKKSFSINKKLIFHKYKRNDDKSLYENAGMKKATRIYKEKRRILFYDSRFRFSEIVVKQGIRRQLAL